MPTVLSEAPLCPPAANPPRKRWTRGECARLEAAGLLGQQHLELIEGELIDRMGKRRPHVNTLSLLYAHLINIFGTRFVNPEAPIDVAPEDNPTNEPEPDLIVLARDLSQFTSANPRPADLHLVVEIADTTLAFDLTTKAALYARAGISEYWVVDIPGRRIIIHRNPQRGAYTEITACANNETAAPLAAPSSSIPVSDLFSE